MTTKSETLSITFDPTIVAALSQLAKQEHKTLPNLAVELILEALERREDASFSALAESRDTGDEETISHEEAWK